MNSLNQKATPWVSYFVLAGCICITGLLVYVSRQAVAVADDWEVGPPVVQYIHAPEQVDQE